MANPRVKILAIVPYKGLHDQLINYVSSRSDVELEVHIGELEEAAEIARKREKDFDVILSRGGTAEAIEKVVSIPVVTLRPTALDLIRVMKMIQAYSGKYAIIGFSDITQDFKTVLDIMQIDAEIHTMTDPSQVDDTIRSLKEQHYSIIIGDVIAVNTAKRMHMNGILITSGIESIQIAVAEALQFYHNQLRKNEMNQAAGRALDHLGKMMLVYDDQKQLLFHNLEGKTLPRTILNRIEDSVDKALETGVYRYSRTVGGKLYHISGYRDYYNNRSAAVFLVSCSVTEKEQEPNAFQYFNEQDDVSEALIDNVGKMAEVYDLAHRFAPLKQPVIIIRENGIEDFDIARSIHRNGLAPDIPMLLIDFENCKRKDLEFLFKNDQSPLSNNDQCIFIRNADKMALPAKRSLFSYIENTKLFARNKLIFSMTAEEFADDEPLFMHTNMSYLQIPIPALRNRKEDIISLATLFLNSYSMQSGRPAISFDNDAEKAMKDYPWYGNTKQLMRVVQYTSLITDSLTIPLENVSKALEAEQLLNDKSVLDQNLLNGTLDQINKYIVNKVLLQENMNKTKVAKRLGISRGTLWRIMRDD